MLMFEYAPGDSLLHKLDVRTKTLGFLLVIVLVFLFDSPLYNLALSVLTMGISIYVGLTWKEIAAKLKPLAVIFVTIILLTGVSYPPGHWVTPLAQRVICLIGGSVYLTAGGVLYGLTLLFRILAMVLMSSVLIYCTPLDDFLQFLQKLHMPYQLAFVLTTAIRFVPTLTAKTEAILDAQRARGSPIGTGGLVQRIRTYVPVMVPMMVEALRMSETLAVAMLNRGYGARPRATPLRELRLGLGDYLFGALFLALIFAGVYLRARGFGQL
jgi:energy-coupling factor transport system permease protein